MRQPEASTSRYAGPNPGLPYQPALDPSWTLVDELPEDDDSEFESEEETTYITLDFGYELPEDILDQVDTLQITDLNTSKPFVRLGRHILRGRHERTIGSDLIFSRQPPDPDGGTAPTKSILVGSTQSRVRFEELEVNPKHTVTSGRQNASSILLTDAAVKPSKPSVRTGKMSARGKSDKKSDGSRVKSAGLKRPSVPPVQAGTSRTEPEQDKAIEAQARAPQSIAEQAAESGKSPAAAPRRRPGRPRKSLDEPETPYRARNRGGGSSGRGRRRKATTEGVAPSAGEGHMESPAGADQQDQESADGSSADAGSPASNGRRGASQQLEQITETPLITADMEFPDVEEF